MPQSAMFLDAELRRMELEIARKQARINKQPRPPGAMSRAEVDEVVGQPVRDDKGRVEGRYSGAIATTMAEKEVFSRKEQRRVTKPTLAGAKWQLDLIDIASTNITFLRSSFPKKDAAGQDHAL